MSPYTVETKCTCAWCKKNHKMFLYHVKLLYNYSVHMLKTLLDVFLNYAVMLWWVKEMHEEPTELTVN